MKAHKIFVFDKKTKCHDLEFGAEDREKGYKWSLSLICLFLISTYGKVYLELFLNRR